MAINPAIAMSFQAPKFEDPMNRLVQMEQLKAYQQNALAKQMEMETAKTALEQQKGLRNYLAGMKSGQDVNINDLAQFGDTGIAYAKNIAAFEKEQRLAEKAKLDSAMSLHKDYWLPKLGNVQTAKDAFNWARAYRQDPRMAVLTGMSDEDEAYGSLPMTNDQVASWKERVMNPSTYQEKQLGRKKDMEQQINDLSKALYGFDPTSGRQVIDPAVQKRLQIIQNQYDSEFGGMVMPGQGAPAQGATGMTPDLAAPVDAVGTQKPVPSLAIPGETVDVGDATGNVGVSEVDVGQTAKQKKAGQLAAQSESDAKKNIKFADDVLESIDYDFENDHSPIYDQIMSSTSGPFQTSLSNAPGYFGISTSGRVAAADLDNLAKNITIQKMQGKLGAGISNADRDFILGLVGNIGDTSIPAEQRLVAFKRFVDGLKQIRSKGYILEPKKEGETRPEPSKAKAAPSDAGPPPGVDAEDWQFMTPEQKALWETEE